MYWFLKKAFKQKGRETDLNLDFYMYQNNNVCGHPGEHNDPEML